MDELMKIANEIRSQKWGYGLDEVIKEIKTYKWRGNREECFRIAKEFKKAYARKFRWRKPTPMEQARLNGIARRLFEEMVYFTQNP